MNNRDRSRRSQFGESEFSQDYPQPQQWQSDVDQFGESYSDPQRNENYERSRAYPSAPQNRGYENYYQRGAGRAAPLRHSHNAYGADAGANFASFTSDDYGGRDFVQPSGGRYAPVSPYSYRQGDEERGFLERAGDHIAKWFGDEEAARRIEEDHRGHGPSGYSRSDSRILEDVCDRLTDDWQVDARNITVSVDEGEVSLDGSVGSRLAKRRAEDCAEAVSGVKHVQNNLRVQLSTPQ
ncbi:MAG: BON domain-containing protein [Novosphingobium sp.]|uniref:BON domain-containing protein n=1 Tax=Tsuneonella sp. CC-YZS046 TaxID=3042152 RepID=UPI002D798D7D|nr:BON domain-containing protein [Tsuneonella sp. CC-YZS046]WRO66679.1 BON domain-containing protein [Tsuneonella sp. CC-YZS046]